MMRLNDVELELEEVRSPIAAVWSVEGENDWLGERFTTNNYLLRCWKLIAFKWSITILQNGCFVCYCSANEVQRRKEEEEDNWIRHLVVRRRRRRNMAKVKLDYCNLQTIKFRFAVINVYFVSSYLRVHLQQHYSPRPPILLYYCCCFHSG